jgi:hypothetical protein
VARSKNTVSVFRNMYIVGNLRRLKYSVTKFLKSCYLIFWDYLNLNSKVNSKICKIKLLAWSWSLVWRIFRWPSFKTQGGDRFGNLTPWRS